MKSLRIAAKHPTISLVDTSTTLNELRQIHAHLLVKGLLNDTQVLGQFVANIAIRNPNNLQYSNKVLDQCQNPTLFPLNSMIRAYSNTPTPEKCFHFYTTILRSRDTLSPDNFTLNFMVRACARLSAARGRSGMSVHCVAIKLGLQTDHHINSGLISMYAEMGCLGLCRRVYSENSAPDLVSQTAMLNACAKCGDLEVAREVFDEMPHRDPVAWNSMIAGYAHSGKYREALDLFRSMQLEGVRVTEVSMVLVLSVCSQLGALDQGRWAHEYVERSKLPVTVSLGTAIIDMYAKCGVMSKAMEVFSGMREKNLYTWNATLGGLAMNGLGEKCLEVFSDMKEGGVRPNEVTFLAVLRGCCVAGLVEEGHKHFHSMKEVYSIEPQFEHYGCLVDLNGRAGRLDEAMGIIKNMPMSPHAGAWGGLLNACRIHKNLELGKVASEKIVELESKNDSAYVQLSNIYAESKDWEGVSNVREAMKLRGVEKLPGCSVVEVDGEVHEFFVGDKSHPRNDEIEEILGEIAKRLKLVGYLANTNPVMFDIEEEEKEDALCRHSEKIAVAFGLVSLKENIPIRIVKNLRICLDCHDVMKYISKCFEREIVVRDRNRFHHFKDGECSCKGYW